MCDSLCEERIVVGDEEYYLAGGDCSKRLSFADKCCHEIAEAKEKIDYFSNSSQARKIWTDEERSRIIKSWTIDLLFWEEQLKHYKGGK